MELKTNYQYTYFIHPFVIKEGKYQKYILKMLKDKDFKLKTFQKEKDFKMYQYFLPKTRDFLFSSFSFGSSKLKKLEELPDETRAALLSKYPCNIFEYRINKDIQGKIEDKKGIFFTISKIEIVCFETGICFLVIKTNVEDDNSFSNVLNFNYKFRDINGEAALDTYDNIRIQTNSFSSAETFKGFIRKVTGSNMDALKLDIDTERFLTYSYACIDQENWNNTYEFDNIKSIYMKYLNILPSDNSVSYSKEDMKVISKWKYAKLGVTKQGVTLFCSTYDINNYTVFPQEFEEQYLYMYILALYTKLYLKKINLEIKQGIKIKRARKEFVKFTQTLWINEATSDDTGSLFYQYLKDVLEINSLFFDTKNKYDILYKEFNIEKSMQGITLVAILMVIWIIVSIIFRI